MIRTFNAVTKDDHAKILAEEYDFSMKNKDVTDCELIEYLKICAELLKRPPKRQEVVGFMLIKRRLGPWPRALEKAGLKEKSQKQALKAKKKHKKVSTTLYPAGCAFRSNKKAQA